MRLQTRAVLPLPQTGRRKDLQPPPGIAQQNCWLPIAEDGIFGKGCPAHCHGRAGSQVQIISANRRREKDLDNHLCDERPVPSLGTNEDEDEAKAEGSRLLRTRALWIDLDRSWREFEPGATSGCHDGDGDRQQRAVGANSFHPFPRSCWPLQCSTVFIQHLSIRLPFSVMLPLRLEERDADREVALPLFGASHQDHPACRPTRILSFDGTHDSRTYHLKNTIPDPESSPSPSLLLRDLIYNPRMKFFLPTTFLSLLSTLFAL